MLVIPSAIVKSDDVIDHDDRWKNVRISGTAKNNEQNICMSPAQPLHFQGHGSPIASAVQVTTFVVLRCQHFPSVRHPPIRKDELAQVWALVNKPPMAI